MNKLLAPILAVALALSAPMAMAGGPIVVEEDIEVVADKPASSVGILPVILVAVALCAALCGGNDDADRCRFAVKC